jgi:hypothetical protein
MLATLLNVAAPTTTVAAPLKRHHRQEHRLAAQAACSFDDVYATIWVKSTEPASSSSRLYKSAPMTSDSRSELVRSRGSIAGRVAVVVATRNRRDSLLRTLERLEALAENGQLRLSPSIFQAFASSRSPRTWARSREPWASTPSASNSLRLPTMTRGGKPARSPAPPRCSTNSRRSRSWPHAYSSVPPSTMTRRRLQWREVR